MTHLRKALAISAAATIIGWDLGSNAAPVRWTRTPKPAPNPKKRAKVKAARKQRSRK